MSINIRTIKYTPVRSNFVLKFIFLYWDTYCCTVVYMYCIELKNVVAQPMNMFVLEFVFYWAVISVLYWTFIVVLKLIFLY